MIQDANKKVHGPYVFKINGEIYHILSELTRRLRKYKIIVSLQIANIQEFICDNLLFSCIVPVIFFQYLFLLIIQSYLSKMVGIWMTFTNKSFTQDHPFVISIDLYIICVKCFSTQSMTMQYNHVFRLRVSSM